MTQSGASQPRSGADRDPIHLSAAEWLVRLRDPALPLEEIHDWQAWMNDDPRHAAAFARIEEISTALLSVPLPERPRASGEWRDDYDGAVPIRDWRPRYPLRWLAVAAAVVAVTVGLALFGISGNLLKRHPESFASRVGENRSIELADGSTVTLGGNSRIEISLGAKARDIELTRGEAFFTVAKDPSRPFSVHAGDATVVAVGTAFNVHRAQDRVSVAVVEGRVLVQPARPLWHVLRPKQSPVQLSTGQETTADEVGVAPSVSIADLNSVAGWRSGRLAFRMQPLRDVLEDVNRYAHKPIVIEDDGIGDLPVTGTVVGGNVSGWLSSLASVLGISVEEDADRIVLKKARS
jgi:transmembrane sensor